MSQSELQSWYQSSKPLLDVREKSLLRLLFVLFHLFFLFFFSVKTTASNSREHGGFPSVVLGQTLDIV
jgi:hypothetical protein